MFSAFFPESSVSYADRADSPSRAAREPPVRAGWRRRAESCRIAGRRPSPSPSGETAMPQIPDTSSTLLGAIAGDAASPRWGEFVALYRPGLAAWLSASFPALGPEAEDLLQETFAAVAAKLPNYRHDPAAKGLFRSFLVGILRNKALHALRARARAAGALEAAAPELAAAAAAAGAGEDADREWRHAAYEFALRDLLADPAVAARTKRVFVRVAVEGAAPAEVAAEYGLARNAVDQIKSRCLRALRERVAGLEGLLA